MLLVNKTNTITYSRTTLERILKERAEQITVLTKCYDAVTR